MSDPSPTHPFHIGVLLLPPIQLLDLAPVDLFSMLTPSYLLACSLPAPLISGGIPVHITYITPRGSSAALTADATLLATASLTTPAVAPGKLDVLFIPGPEPGFMPDEATREFVRGHVGAEKTSLLAVCTGVLVAGHAGVLRGRRATGPRALLGRLREGFGGVEWIDRRWVGDGGVWSSGGITNGHDMVAAFLRERFPGPVVEAVCAMADVGERGEEYGQSKAGMFGWFGWLVLRAWVAGLGRKGEEKKAVRMLMESAEHSWSGLVSRERSTNGRKKGL